MKIGGGFGIILSAEADTNFAVKLKRRACKMRYFKEHPESVGESYTGHMASAFSFGTAMIASGFACLIHGIFPFLFASTGSRKITELHTRMVTHRHKTQGRAPRDIRHGDAALKQD